MPDELSREAQLLDAFDECLTRLQAGESISDCLAYHPALAEELRPLLEAAQAALAASHVARPVQMRSRARFLTAAAERRKPAAAPTWRRVLSPLAALAATFVIVWLAISVASDISLGSNTPTPSPTHTPTLTATPLVTATPTSTASQPVSPTPSLTPTPTATTPAASATPSPTRTASPTQTLVIIQPTATFTVTPESGDDNSNDNSDDNSNDNSGGGNGNDNGGDDNANDNDNDNSGSGGGGGDD